MALRAAVPADVTRNAVSFARAMTIAVRAWAFYPPEHPPMAIAIDKLLAEILERELDGGPARRDATWKAMAGSTIMGRKTFTAEEQQRRLEISRDLGGWIADRHHAGRHGPGHVPHIAMRGRILQDCNPFGADNPNVHETLTALATLRDDRALPQIGDGRQVSIDPLAYL